jgi:hypothetical protein
MKASTAQVPSTPTVALKMPAGWDLMLRVIDLNYSYPSSVKITPGRWSSPLLNGLERFGLFPFVRLLSKPHGILLSKSTPAPTSSDIRLGLYPVSIRRDLHLMV